MMTLEEIKDKLRHVESEVAEVRVALDQLEAAPSTNGPLPATEVAAAPSQVAPTAPPSGLDNIHWPPEVKWVDKEKLRQAVDALFERMGIADVEPIGAEELQRRMREDGIKAEDNILSRGIIEMREE